MAAFFRILTKDKVVKTWIMDKLVDKNFFISFTTEPKKLNQIPMLESCQKWNLILKLCISLSWTFS